MPKSPANRARRQRAGVRAWRIAMFGIGLGEVESPDFRVRAAVLVRAVGYEVVAAPGFD